MINNDNIILEGKYAILEPLQPTHTNELYKAAAYEDIWRFMPMMIYKSEDMKQLVDDAILKKQTGLEYPFIVRDKSSGIIVGSTRYLEISTANRSLEIGWTWYTPNAQGTLINPECKYLLLEYAFDTLSCIRVQLKTDSRNIRSQRAIEKIGGVREGVLRNHRVLSDGYIRDSVFYSIIDTEWQDVKKLLLNRLKI